MPNKFTPTKAVHFIRVVTPIVSMKLKNDRQPHALFRLLQSG